LFLDNIGGALPGRRCRRGLFRFRAERFAFLFSPAIVDSSALRLYDPERVGAASQEIFMSLRFALVLGCLSASLFAPHRAFAQDKQDKVRIPTVDGVTLQGTFYPAKNAGGKVPPTVLLVPNFGEKASKAEWVALATSLQEKFAVMTFDFRGHGDSTEVEPSKFGKYAANVQGMKKYNREKTELDYKDFKEAYMPVLCNDIAAIKGYLDRKNDQGQCNTSTFILIGAEQGATIASVWLNSENFRYRVIPNPMFPAILQPLAADATPEARSVVACIWLSITPKFAGKQLSMTKLLENAAKAHATPMVFMYGKEDEKGSTYTNAVLSALKPPSLKEKLPYTGAVPVEKTKLAGAGLLAKSLNTDAAIAEWISGVLKKKNNEWLEKEQRKATYCWRMAPNAAPIIIKPAEDQNIHFDTYEKFIPR